MRAVYDQVVEDLGTVSPETELRGHELQLGDAWDFEHVFGVLHDFARTYPFDTEQEDYLVHITTGTHVAQICLFLLTETRHLPARLIQTSPPRRREDSAGGGRYSLIDLDLSRYDRIATRFSTEHAEGVSLLKSGIATRNAAFNRQIEQIELVALRSREPMLLMGPTGAGKSLLAKRIFELKSVRHQLTGPFVEVNCATLRGDGAHSALFGHAKGAFTGAAKDRRGLLATADGGLLFLDEIGELGLDEQAMLLRALEEKRFFPLGADAEVGSAFQLVAGTNCDLRAAVVEGRFREDLLARIDLWTYELPGLKDRREDIGPNLDFELDAFEQRNGIRVRFNREARTRYLAFATGTDAEWRGNFRDLNASVVRMATLATAGRINEAIVAEEMERLRRSWGAGGRRVVSGVDLLLEALGPERVDALDRFDIVQLADVIAVCRESRSLSDAGRKLFAVSRQAKAKPNDADRLRKYLAKFDLSFGSL